MSKIRIEVISGIYDNSDAYEEVINYIAKPRALTGVSAIDSHKPETVINGFTESREQSLSDSDDNRNLWHIYISSKSFKNKYKLLEIASNMAFLFNNYQVYYGVHSDTKQLHIHFAINAYSYHPTFPTLNQSALINYLHKIRNYLSLVFSTTSIEIQFGKDGPYV